MSFSLMVGPIFISQTFLRVYMSAAQPRDDLSLENIISEWADKKECTK